MFCLLRCLKCLRKKEPLRDVSFIKNSKERNILTDAIHAVNSIDGWDLIRKGEVTEITSRMNISLHNEDSLYSTIGLLSHMADNWDSWVEKRSARQDIDEKNKKSIEAWIRSHQYTTNTNNFILFSYLENLLRYIEDWSIVDRQGAGADDLIYAIECVIAKSDDRVEVYRKVVSINIPSDYQLTKELMDKHKEYIVEYEKKQEELDKLYEVHLNILRLAILDKDLAKLQTAIRDATIRIKDTPEYLVAIGLEQLIIETNHNL